MTAKFSDAEIEAVHTYAAAARLAVAAYVSEAACGLGVAVSDRQAPGVDGDSDGDSAESLRPDPVMKTRQGTMRRGGCCCWN